MERLSKLSLEVKTIAPLHGLVWKYDPKLIVELYVKWARAIPEVNKVVVFYNSMYGNIDAAISFILNGLERHNAQIKVFKFTDAIQSSISGLIGEVIDSKGIVIGSSTYNSDIFQQ